ncbi:MAG: DUF3332 family protein [Myxococcales bacterium]|nr:DUF3332 family protein [Myxococcales bacterium]MCB9715113.1 DUF3332 family protein [Myxococcales bacterium]
MKRTFTDLPRRELLLSLGLLGLAGCWGSFSLTGRVYDWNGSFSSKWASWAVFLVFIILPVYGTLLFIDAIALNTIEFFSGRNPVQRKADLGNGHHLVMHGDEERTRLRVEHYEGDRLVRTFHVERLADDELRISDGEGRARLHVAGHRGGARLRDEQGRTIADLDREAYEAAAAAGREGRSMAEPVLDGLDTPGLHRMLATSDRLARRGWA